MTSWPEPRPWTPPDLARLTRAELESRLRTEEAANYWLSYGITVWCGKAQKLEQEHDGKTLKKGGLDG